MGDTPETQAVDKEAAKEGFLGTVREQLGTATGKAKDGLQYILDNANKVDINDDGTADLSQLKDTAKNAGKEAIEALDSAGGFLKEKGAMAYEAIEPAVEEASSFMGKNMFSMIALVGGGLLASMLGMGPLGMIAMALIGAMLGGLLGDKEGSVIGDSALGGMFGHKKEETTEHDNGHSQDVNTGSPDKSTGILLDEKGKQVSKIEEAAVIAEGQYEVKNGEHVFVVTAAAARGADGGFALDDSGKIKASDLENNIQLTANKVGIIASKENEFIVNGIVSAQRNAEAAAMAAANETSTPISEGQQATPGEQPAQSVPTTSIAQKGQENAGPVAGS